MSGAFKSDEMRRAFDNRGDLVAYLRAQFPAAAARGGGFSAFRGGRRAALARLSGCDPGAYAASRNSLNGSVTRLSPYLRHGVIGLREVVDSLQKRHGGLVRARKLVQELAWRDYWRRVWARIGDGIWEDRETYKTGFHASHYTGELPRDVESSATGLACMDAFARELKETGYLHNHARMWLAAYLVHWRRVRWQAGARWFLSHLADGDAASNNLSWQWVASSFSSKPYFFNRENLETYTQGAYCRACPRRGWCEFEGTYPDLRRKLFPLLEPGA